MTLLQAARNPGRDTNFTFAVDETVTNLTVYITGQSIRYTVTSPSGETTMKKGPPPDKDSKSFTFTLTYLFEGESQEGNETTGSLIIAAESVGNFINLQLKNQAGQWSLKITSSNPYTVRVIGERRSCFSTRGTGL